MHLFFVRISQARQATYKNFFDALYEIQINDVRHYFIINSHE
jgi:hypothetical protein